MNPRLHFRKRFNILGASLNPREKVNVCKFAHLLCIVRFHDLFIIEEYPARDASTVLVKGLSDEGDVMSVIVSIG
jgi:hypothetical protein